MSCCCCPQCYIENYNFYQQKVNNFLENYNYYQENYATTTVPSPKNGLGENVDWFLIFKLPENSRVIGDKGDCVCNDFTKKNCDYIIDGGDKKERKSGTCYYYADSKNPTLQYYKDIGLGCLSTENNPLKQTLDQINITNFNSFFWNDQQADGRGCGAPYAHSKGAVIYNEKGGLVINTSTPNWPTTENQRLGCFEVSNVDFAQHIFCFSLDASSVSKWIEGVKVSRICIDETKIKKNNKFTFDDDIKDDSSLKSTSTKSVFYDLKTQGKNTVIGMFKSAAEEYLPWSLVSNTLNTGLLIASWTGFDDWGDSGLYSKNNKYCLSQITGVKMPNTNNRIFQTTYGVSHSKWAISNDSKNPLVIFGSSNMQDTQAKRGSDFYAIRNPYLWKSFNDIIITKKTDLRDIMFKKPIERKNLNPINRNNTTNCKKL